MLNFHPVPPPPPLEALLYSHDLGGEKGKTRSLLYAKGVFRPCTHAIWALSRGAQRQSECRADERTKQGSI